MAQTMPITPAFKRQLFAALEESPAHEFLQGWTFGVPFKTLKRKAWDDAIAWLEAREAARAEWPWPER